jgi:tetratricopeptide (TPR) repeat protein
MEIKIKRILTNLASAHPVLKKIVEWFGWILTCFACAFLVIFVFILLSILINKGDYEISGRDWGKFIGCSLVLTALVLVQNFATDWSADKLVYSRLGKKNINLYKTVFILFAIPFITAICAGWLGYILYEITDAIDEYDCENLWTARILWFIVWIFVGVIKGFSQKKYAEVAFESLISANKFFYENDLDKAKKYCQKALDLWSAIPSNKNSEIADVYVTLGQIHRSENKYDSAVADYEKGLEIRIKELGENHTEILDYYDLIAETYEEKEDFKNATNYRLKALDIIKNIYDLYDSRTATALTNLGCDLAADNQIEDAIEFLELALDIYQITKGPNCLEVSKLYELIADLYIQNSDIFKVRETYEKVLMIKEKIKDIEKPS